jgi:hypothetical protein
MMNYSRLSVLSALSIAVVLNILGCATTPGTGAGSDAPISAPMSYDQKLEKYSAGDSEYSGFYNNFEYKATLLNSFERDVIFTREAESYQWDKDKQALERAKINKDVGTGTQVFVSFFTPDHANDNLTDFKSIWKVYLDVGGQRYQGKIKRLRSLLVELQAQYPYHTRWNTPYLVTFPVPTATVETQPSTLTITGPLGTRAVSFLAIQ